MAKYTLTYTLPSLPAAWRRGVSLRILRILCVSFSPQGMASTGSINRPEGDKAGRAGTSDGGKWMGSPGVRGG